MTPSREDVAAKITDAILSASICGKAYRVALKQMGDNGCETDLGGLCRTALHEVVLQELKAAEIGKTMTEHGEW